MNDRRRRSSWWILARMLALSGLVSGGCGNAPPSTAVVLNLDTSETKRPYTLELDWFGPDGLLFKNLRVPEDGSLPATGARLASVFIEQGNTKIGHRRAFVHGDLFGATKFWGIAEANQIEGDWVDVTLQVVSGTFPDADKDGLPDLVDICPGKNDYLGACP